MECRLIACPPTHRRLRRAVLACVLLAWAAGTIGCASIRRANQIGDPGVRLQAEIAAAAHADSLEAARADSLERVHADSFAAAPPDTLGLAALSAVHDSLAADSTRGGIAPHSGGPDSDPTAPASVAVALPDTASGWRPPPEPLRLTGDSTALAEAPLDSAAIVPVSADSLAPVERVVYGPPVPANLKRGSSGLVPDFGLGSVLRRTPKLAISDLKGGEFHGLGTPLYDHQPGQFDPIIPDSTFGLRVLQIRDNPNYTTATTFDPERRVVSQSSAFAGVPTTWPYIRDNEEYGREQLRYALRRQWRTAADGYLFHGQDYWNDPYNSRGRKLRIEAELPSALTSVFGSGAHFDISGSERISIGGTSDFNKISPNLLNPHRSIFPSLNMRQDLQVQLGGSIGDKIDVNVDQRSNVSTDLENHIGINYRGYHDEIIQELNLGNTSLSLQGSRYVSYGGQHQGLFGIRSQLALGGVEITSIASKEQAKGGRVTKVPDRDRADPITVDQYIHGRVFFLTSPVLGAPPAASSVNDSSITVYIGRPRSESRSRLGRAFLYANDITRVDSLGVQAYFTELKRNTDYYVDPFYVGLPVIVLNEQVRDNEMLAVTYRLNDAARTAIGTPASQTPAGDTLRLKALRVANGDTRNPKDLLQGPWAPLRVYENRSWYDLGTTNFNPEAQGFKLNIFRVNGAGQDANNKGGALYIQLLGLDEEDGTTNPDGSPHRAPDGRVDTRYFDRVHGYLRFPYNKWEPFWLSDPAFGSKVGDPLAGDNEDRIYREDWSSVPRPQDFVPKYYFQAEGIGVVTRLELGKTDIREGSEQVDVDGLVLQRDVDYAIDYTTGTLELKSQRARKADGRYTVAYSYNPLFGLSQNSIMGTSATFRLGKVQSNGIKPHQMSATWLYEGRGGVSKLEHPKLEDSPAKTVVGDITGSFAFRPEIVSRLVDALPLVRAGATPSNINVDAEIGASVPNPNTRNLAFLDDMQATRRITSVLPEFQRWFWSGIPEGALDAAATRTEAAERQAAFRWYNLPSDKDVSLTQAEVYPDSLLSQSEKTSPVTVLNLHVDPRGGTSATSPDPTKAWSGLTQLISTTGDDFSQYQYLDVYLRVADSLDIPKQPLSAATLDRMANLKLHIDLGILSEDAEWMHGRAPDGILQTEDRDHNNDFANVREDTGLDTLWSKVLDNPTLGSLEPGYDPALKNDPSGDDYRFTTANRPNYDFSHINGTEGNNRLDSEDLNGNSILDTHARFFEFTLNLGGQAVRDEATKYPELKNGFRLFQIPLSEAIAVSGDGISQPTWQQIQHCRIWLEGADEPMSVQLVRLDIVGNVWLERPVQDALTKVTVRVASTKGAGSALYEPPPGSLQRDPSSFDRGYLPENSLVLDFQRLQPGQYVSAFRNFLVEQSYVQYDSLEMWVRLPELDMRNDAPTYFFRFGADSVNYYEYRTRLGDGPGKPGDWRSVFVPLGEVTRTKLEPEGTLRLSRDYPGADSLARYRLVPRGGGAPPDTVLTVGSPSLTRIKRLEMGVVNRLENEPLRGLLYVDEVRLGAVRKERGLARRASIGGNLSDLGNFNMSYEQVDANFLRIGAAEGAGSTTRLLSALGGISVDRFLPAWGMTIPLSYQWTETRGTPKFQPGSDTRYGRDLQDRYATVSGNSTLATSFQKRATHNNFMRYTLDALSGNVSYSTGHNLTTTAVDSTRAASGSMHYGVQAGIPRSGGTGQLLLPVLRWGKVLGLAMPRMRNATLRYMPTSVRFDVQARSQHGVSYVRSLSAGQLDTAVAGSGIANASKTGTLAGGVTFQPFDDLRNVQLTVSSQRDLTQPLGRSVPILGNSGRETGASRTLSMDYQPGWLRVVGGSVSFNGGSDITSDANLRQSNDAGDVYGVGNRQRVEMSGRLPMGWLFGRPRRVPPTLKQQAAANDSTKAPEVQQPSISPITRLRQVLSGILTVNEAAQVTHSVQRGARFDRVGSLPGMAFQLGLSNSAPGLLQLEDYRTSSTRSVSDGANVRGTLLGIMTVSARYSVTEDNTLSNNAGNPRRGTVWPDLVGTIPTLESRLPVLKRFFSTLSLDTNYRKQTSRTYRDLGRSTLQESTDQTAFQPLIALQGSLKGGVTATFRSEHTKSVTSYGTSGGFNNSENWDYSLQMRKQFDSKRGFPLPWGTRIKLHNPLNTSFAFTYNTSRAGNSLSPQLTDNTRKWNLISTADYNVGQDVRTSFNLQIGRRTPLLDGNWHQTVKLETALEYIFQ